MSEKIRTLVWPLRSLVAYHHSGVENSLDCHKKRFLPRVSWTEAVTTRKNYLVHSAMKQMRDGNEAGE